MTIDTNRRRIIHLGGLGIVGSLATIGGPTKAADKFPARPIRLVVGYSAGGAADTLARVLGTRAAEKLGQPLIIDNKPGAGGLLAAEAVATSPPDGYTLFLSDDGQLAIAPGINDARATKLSGRLSPLFGLTALPMVLVVNNAVPAGNLRELISLCKSRPGQINYASAGNGNISHVSGELFKHLANVFVVHIPYKGGAPGLAAVVAGDVQMMFVSIPTAISFIKAGKVRALAVANVSRSPTLSMVPTAIEAGLKDMVAVSWHGIGAPVGLPTDVQASLERDFLDLLRAPEVSQRLSDLGFEVTPRGQTAFGEWVKSETEKWRRLARVASIKPDA